MSAGDEPLHVRVGELHCRRIEMRGYRLADGQFEVEGHLVDTKPFDFSPASAGYTVPAGQPIHDMGLALTIDHTMVVTHVRTFINATPYEICGAAGIALRRIVGLQIGRGWRKEIQRRLIPADRCTHLAELLGPMATTAFQMLSGQLPERPEPVDASGRPVKIGSCYAYSPHREIVQQRWPEFHLPHDAESN